MGCGDLLPLEHPVLWMQRVVFPIIFHNVFFSFWQWRRVWLSTSELREWPCRCSRLGRVGSNSLAMLKTMCFGSVLFNWVGSCSRQACSCRRGEPASHGRGRACRGGIGGSSRSSPFCTFRCLGFVEISLSVEAAASRPCSCGLNLRSLQIAIHDVHPVWHSWQ